jgi:hypothetical protein
MGWNIWSQGDKMVLDRIRRLGEFWENLPAMKKIVLETPRDFFQNTIDRFRDIESVTVSNMKGFENAFDYFREAKKCYMLGCFKSALILAFSALECYMRYDYYYQKKEVFRGSMEKLLNKYFYEKIFPSTYSELSKTYQRLRNDCVHPQPTDSIEFSRPIVRSNIEIVSILISHILKRYR